MITYDRLNEQNHRITELSSVLRFLFRDRAMCDTVDKEMYTELLKSPDTTINNVTKNFMSDSVEVKKIFKAFPKQWYTATQATEFKIKEHEHFLTDTNELFDMVLRVFLKRPSTCTHW